MNEAMNSKKSINWNELLKKKPREIIFSEKNIPDLIDEDNVLNENLFRLKNLNFLEITNCNALNCLDSRISKLENLTNLVLQGNRLQTVPGEHIFTQFSTSIQSILFSSLI